MDSFLCHKCGRAISNDARRCLWCGAAADDSSLDNAPVTFIEMEYDSGIERLSDPTPVRLAVHRDGVQINEVMPGTRSVWIAADQIIEASASGAMISVGREPRRRLSIIGALINGGKRGDPPGRRYTLTITYRDGDSILKAILHREDELIASSISRIARLISNLAKASPRPNSSGQD